MQSIKFLALLLAILTWTACKNSDKANPQHSDHPETTAGATEHSGEHTYACPMHPEVTGKAGDTCPKCGMDLEHNDNAGVDLPVAMEFRSEPASLEAGKGATLYITPKRSDDPKAAVALDLQHGKKIHLIAVSEDLSYFEHIHPEYDASGAYIIKVLPKGQNYTAGPGHNETRFDAGGNYFLFADYKTGPGASAAPVKLTLKTTCWVDVVFVVPPLSSSLPHAVATSPSAMAATMPVRMVRMGPI